MEGLLLIEAMPDLAIELTGLLLKQDDLLAAQVAGLRIVDRRRCGDDFCASMYTVPPPSGTWGPGTKMSRFRGNGCNR